MPIRDGLADLLTWRVFLSGPNKLVYWLFALHDQFVGEYAPPSERRCGRPVALPRALGREPSSSLCYPETRRSRPNRAGLA